MEIQDSMKTQIVTLALLFFCLFLTPGCQQRGIVIELHLPVKLKEITIVIDHEAGAAPKWASPNKYLVHFSNDGAACIDSFARFEQWHKTVLVINGTPTKKFRLTNPKVIPAYDTTRFPGGVSQKSKEDGTKVTYDIVYTQ